MSLLSTDPLTFWYAITRWGEAQVVLPASLVCLLWLLWSNFQQRRSSALGVIATEVGQGRNLAACWLGTLAVAAAITTISKIAFIGYALGYAPLNFTGASGHTLFASAVFPLLMVVMGSAGSRTVQRTALCAGIAMAILVGISRHRIGVHSASEIVAGWLLGGTVSAFSLTHGRWPPARTRQAAWLPLLVILLWLSLSTTHLPAARTHQWVVQLSLKLSGRKEPYTRAQMMQEWRLRKAGVRLED
jgi:membrane-associated phospholipid phosphatase